MQQQQQQQRANSSHKSRSRTVMVNFERQLCMLAAMIDLYHDVGKGNILSYNNRHHYQGVERSWPCCHIDFNRIQWLRNKTHSTLRAMSFVNSKLSDRIHQFLIWRTLRG